MSCLSPGLRIWAACHKHWAYSSRSTGKTHRATRQPTSVSPTLSYTLPWLPTHLWVPLAHHRPCWTGNVRAGNTLLLHPCVVLPVKSDSGMTANTTSCTCINPLLAVIPTSTDYCCIMVIYVKCCIFPISVAVDLFCYVILCILWGLQWYKFIGITNSISYTIHIFTSYTDFDS